MTALSVIIPLYECGDHIGRSIDSVLRQGFREGEVEILVIDDGSTDQGPAKVQALAAVHKCIRLISQPHAGMAAARNRGLAEARGKYVYFMNGGDYLVCTALPAMVTICERSEAEIMTAGSVARHEDAEPLFGAAPKIKPEIFGSGADYFCQLQGLEGGAEGGSFAYLTRRSFIERLGTRFAEGAEGREEILFWAEILPHARCMLGSRIILYARATPAVGGGDTQSAERAVRLQYELASLHPGLPAKVLEYYTLPQRSRWYGKMLKALKRWRLGSTLRELRQEGFDTLGPFPPAGSIYQPGSAITRPIHRLLWRYLA